LSAAAQTSHGIPLVINEDNHDNKQPTLKRANKGIPQARQHSSNTNFGTASSTAPTLKSTAHVVDVEHLNHIENDNAAGLISTSSWRLGEALAQKQIRQHISAQVKQQHNLVNVRDELDQGTACMITTLGYKKKSSSSEEPLGKDKGNQAKRIRRVDCHLVEPPIRDKYD
jgi:hypothetical protein